MASALREMIRHRMVELHISQRELAKKTGMGYDYWSNILDGNWWIPRRKMAAVATKLGYHVDDIQALQSLERAGLLEYFPKGPNPASTRYRDLAWAGEISLPEYLRILREGVELTQEELARYVGVQSKYISQMESGKRLPSRRLVPKIAAALRVSSSNLFLVLDRDS